MIPSEIDPRYCFDVPVLRIFMRKSAQISWKTSINAEVAKVRNRTDLREEGIDQIGEESNSFCFVSANGRVAGFG